MIIRRGEHREFDFWMAEGMTEVTAGLEMRMVCFKAARIVDASRVLTRKVRREDCVNDAAMNVTGAPVVMVCLGMHMEQGNHEQP